MIMFGGGFPCQTCPQSRAPTGRGAVCGIDWYVSPAISCPRIGTLARAGNRMV